MESNFSCHSFVAFSLVNNLNYIFEGNGDNVTCFCCGGTLRLDNWMTDDELWEKHALLSPNCAWLLKQKGTHFVDEVEKKSVSLYVH